MLVRSNAVDMVVVDSVAALTPKAEIEGEMGDVLPGLQARLMSQALRKLTAVVHKQNSTVVFINQLRQKIGIVFGNPETTPGGQALKFYASVRLDIRRIGQLKQGDEAICSRVRVKVVKNKVAPPFRQAEFEVLFGAVINQLGELVDLGVTYGIVEKSGAWFILDGERIGQGRDKACAFLAGNLEAADSLRDRLTTTMKALQDTMPAPMPSAEEERPEAQA
jgi:recombination protein RecA